ncbi:MAG: hypothetical protein GY943_27555 [Chloroflexi bacterium]|nr:hypothetical protein [Chloroflexota bacterium]
MTQINALLNVITNTVAPMLIIVSLSIILGRFKKLNVQTLSRVSIYLFSPSLILSSISQSGLGSAELTNIVIAAASFCMVMGVLGLLFAKLLRYNREMASSFALAAMITNSVNFGLPFIEFGLGSSALEPAVAFSVGQVLVAYLFGTFIASRGKGSVKSALLNVLTIPMPYAFMLGLWLNSSGTQLPAQIGESIEILGRAMIPTGLIILGLQLRGVKLNGRWRPILTVSFTRFFIGVTIAYLISFIFKLEGINQIVFILQASMPAGILSGILSTEFGADAEYSSAIIFVTTIASTVFLSILLLVLT